MNPVTLQINLAPTDLGFIDVILPHQIRVLQDQVSDIVLTCDVRPTRGRFSASDKTIQEFQDRLEAIAGKSVAARVVFVDYSESTAASVASDLNMTHPIPSKDYRGGPFYCYFFGIYCAPTDYVLHLDSDMLLGGSNTNWVKEAIDQFQKQENLFAVKPWSGPPRRDGSSAFMRNSSSFTTRCFLISKQQLRKLCADMRYDSPGLARSLYARRFSNPAVSTPEDLITRAMKKHGLVRTDLLGLEGELWTLHPQFRCNDFYAKLPDIVEKVESGIVPDAQRGVYNINMSMVDWTEALEAMPCWRRIWLRLKRLDSLRS